MSESAIVNTWKIYLSFRQSLVSLSALFLLLVVALQAVVAVEEELELPEEPLQVIVVFLALLRDGLEVPTEGFQVGVPKHDA